MYKNKYIKYKNKYLILQKKLKDQIAGGQPIIQDITKINLFTSGSNMEEYLNPIYGLYMCKSGYITNNYWLQEKEIKDNKDTNNKHIYRLSRYLDNKVQPNLKVMQISPIDIGRYIALLYICKNNSNFLQGINTSKQYKFNLGPKVTHASSIDEKILQKYISNVTVIKIEIPLNPIKPLELLDFYIVLYCLWWVLNNDKGISDYYAGIQEVFDIYNKYYPLKSFYISSGPKLVEDPKLDSFEKILIYITKKNDFNLFTTEYTNSFCKNTQGNNITYSDCGEVTGRNLINLICFNGNRFDITKLEELGAIPELIEYYSKFFNFEEQSSGKKEIYGEVLNSRDAWSKLIIFYANKNIKFSRQTIQAGTTYNYDMDTGMALDNTVSNFFQLISNLLPLVTKWTDIKNLNIDDKTINGIGKINIIDDKYNTYVINTESGHYYMDYMNKENEDIIKQINFTHLNPKQISIISLLLNKKQILTEENYIFCNYDTNNFPEYINNNRNPHELYIKLLMLSFTNLINEDTRRRIDIILNDESDLYFIGTILKTINTDILNQYTYTSTDLEFLNEIPLTKLTLIVTSFRYNNIDLTPMKKIKSIGNNFFEKYNLNTIDLSSLTNVTFIGNVFMSNNTLYTIDLSPLSNVTFIGIYFMRKSILETIDLRPLSKLESIGNYFMNSNVDLKSIDLSGLINLKSIGDGFMVGCKNIQSIDLSGLINLKSIGEGFMIGCTNIQIINLSGLIKLESIGTNFLYVTNFKEVIHIKCSEKIVNLIKISNSQLIIEKQSIDNYVISRL